jgi:hypothetical protein
MPHTSQLRIVILLALLIVYVTASVGCAQGDDPQTLAVVKKHVSPRGIKTMKGKDDREYIFSLNVPDTRDALEILPHLGKLEYLTTLNIAYKGLTNRDLAALPPLPRLQEFRMGPNLVSDDGLKHLAGMKELRRLMLHGVKIVGPGLAHLKDSSQLERLDLGGTDLNDSGIPHIVANFKRLRRFDFLHTKVTPEGLLQLAELLWLVDLAWPEDIVGPITDRKAQGQAKLELAGKYLAAYKEFKRKARAAGEKVPPDHIHPFGAIE